MSEPAVVVEGLRKRYLLGGTAQGGYRTLRDTLAGLFRPTPARSAARELMALDGVSFVVGEGEALGVIGHNGAGKSTLLKILSRVTEPTEGWATLRGRVASLLEVGTGFHPELTGRENIFLNGTILGMTRAEIRHHFDDIVAFAEVERFLDTPVKHYSSGMHVRLGFAVAAHLTPEILIVDEVLAVGDFEFQRRCLGRMGQVAHSGRTVLFVSHNLRAIEQLCPRTLLLRRGVVERIGPTREVVAHYLSRRVDEAQGDIAAFPDRDGNGKARLTRIEVLARESDDVLDEVTLGQDFRVRLHYVSDTCLAGIVAGLAILDEEGDRIVWTSSDETQDTLPPLSQEGVLECVLERPNLLPGTYSFELWIGDRAGGDYADHVRGVGRLQVGLRDWRGVASVALLTMGNRGYVHIPCHWRPASK